jgi:uncharacterized protein YdeI (YjbR/CyaY-like superfamily)
MKSQEKASTELPIRSFRRSQSWVTWLEKNHAKSSGIWLRIAKKGAAIDSVSYGQALEAALCYGWIDAQKKSHDESSWLQKFTPRGPRSIWSKINREKAQELIKSGRMKAAGLQAVGRAKESGQWNAAYDGQRGIEVPADLQIELDRNPAAKAFFAELNSINRYAILHRIQTAKQAETRAKRIRQFVEMLEKREKIYR